MRKNMTRLFSVLSVLIMLFSMISPVVTEKIYAADNDDYRLVVVSLGDSYSAGEGIEPFYGQGETRAKIYDLDWLAHRSELSWPGRLTFSKIKGHTLKEYKYDETYSEVCQWYFRAASGAETKHVLNKKQPKYVRFPHPTLGYLSNDGSLPVQIDIFDTIDSSEVDYVTLTIGGNDVDFSKIITDCVTGSSYLHSTGRNKKLDEHINRLWENIEKTKKDISDVYTTVLKRAPNAEIIVAGYPELLNYDGKGTVISKQEALTVNKNVRWFNDNLERLVAGCNDPRIHFVSVEEAFATHQAYSDEQWINEIKWGPCPEDLAWLPYKDAKSKVKVNPASSYSIHPNARGAQAYADCVNLKIAEIENNHSVDVQGGTITDSWEEIIASCDDGTYKDKYKIGDTKALDLGYEGVIEMQIAAFDVDELADGSGKAAITWIAKQLLNSDHRINPYPNADSGFLIYNPGSGAAGGWEFSEIRSWLKSDIKPLIPANVRQAIQPVKKHSLSWDASADDISDVTTSDDIWIPSGREVFEGLFDDEKGPEYTALYATENSLIKTKSDSSVNTEWWLRSADYWDAVTFSSVDTSGSYSFETTDSSYGVAIGFCIGSSDGKDKIITDSWKQIIESIDDGTYKSKYNIGDLKELNLDSEGIVKMQIAAFDTDELADGSGKAAITWISKQPLNSDHRMNPGHTYNSDGSYALVGTGSIGGWESCEMREWLKNDIKPLIPSTVEDSIKTVTKYSTSWDTAEQYEHNAVTEDDVWIPSWHEVFGTIFEDWEQHETLGPTYTDLFGRNITYGNELVDKKVGEVDPSWWWQRSAGSEFGVSGSQKFRYVSNNWSADEYADEEKSVILGFCL